MKKDEEEKKIKYIGKGKFKIDAPTEDIVGFAVIIMIAALLMAAYFNHTENSKKNSFEEELYITEME